MKKTSVAIILVLISFLTAQPQIRQGFQLNEKMMVSGFVIENIPTEIQKPMPLFSIDINEETFQSSSAKNIEIMIDSLVFDLKDGLHGKLIYDSSFENGIRAFITISNHSQDTLVLENFVPFGKSDDHLFITSSGSWDLARAKIFRPGLGPVGIILPDNAWELGYSSLMTQGGNSIYALARRTKWDNAKRYRCKTDVFPGGSVTWTMWAETFEGEWQNGLRKVFQQRWLYDLELFDNRLFERPDLQWIKSEYLLTLQMAWDHEYYDAFEEKYKLRNYLDNGKKYMGGYDVYSIWPTWPRLGVDQRNQWDLYEDLPGGLNKMRELAAMCQDEGTKFFIAFNPWDQSTREENPYKGMARLIKATNADGVVLDTKGSSSYELQHAADSVRGGVIMYSEGMAIPKDMPGIIAGRVHDAIYMPPPLNMNKLIKPDFAIFRVCQLSQGRIHREANISLFNGYGIELNTYYPGRPSWMEEEFIYLGKIVKILRENSETFNSYAWTPLLNARADSIWVNCFPAGNKTVYTIYSLIPEGFDGALFKQEIPEGCHAVSLWHHHEIIPDTIGNQTWIAVYTSAFDKSWIGTRQESNVDVVAILPALLETSLQTDLLKITAEKGEKIVVTAGNPTYQSLTAEFRAGIHELKIGDIFGRYEGKIVVQLFDENDQLMDERVLESEPSAARLISKNVKTMPAVSAPAGMVEIPAGSFSFEASNPDPFIPYPANSAGEMVYLERFFMDEYPVTNQDFQLFLKKSHYEPNDQVNFLKHWSNGTFAAQEHNFPVVWVSQEDATAFCNYAGKRLPTEAEWQYSGQGTDGRKWPWGNEFDSTLCNNASGNPTPVDRFHLVESPFGVKDLVGNVWQLTQDVYDNGSYYFAIMKGGSYYKPTSSWWYVQGGPQPLTHQQMLLLVSPGFNRNATVGFRCVKDAVE